MPAHSPYVVPMADVVDGFVLRCECGCDLFESYPTKAEAERAREAVADL